MRWYYFGCWAQAGHFLFTEGMRYPLFSDKEHSLTKFDGLLAPQGIRTPYIATVSRLGGWGYSALSFWDNSVDTRPGSNSIIFAPSLSVSYDGIMKGFQRYFPEVWSRVGSLVKLRQDIEGIKP